MTLKKLKILEKRKRLVKAGVGTKKTLHNQWLR